MIKAVYCVRKKDGISDDEFRDYWLNKHGPLVDSVSDVLAMKRYVQSHTTLPEIGDAIAAQRGMQPGFDGITEVWYASVEEAMAALSTDEGQAANQKLAEDESRFIDVASSTLFLTEEHPIFDR